MGAFTPQHLQAMSEEQLAALLAKLKDDAGLQEKLKGAADLDAAVSLAKEAGFDVSKADWLKHQAKQTLELSDEELEGVAGGRDRRLGGGGLEELREDEFRTGIEWSRIFPNLRA
jgi:predicted ribosomally synthesized peptide with nif11-like leader